MALFVVHPRENFDISKSIDISIDCDEDLIKFKDNFEFIECSNDNLSNFVLDFYLLKLPKLLISSEYPVRIPLISGWVILLNNKEVETMTVPIQ